MGLLRFVVCLCLGCTAAIGQPCPWVDFAGGSRDLNTVYRAHWGEARADERLVVRGEFPHARYLSFTIYEEATGRVVDQLNDVQLLEIRGWNPFLPGIDRHKPYFGEYEIDVRMTTRPAGARAANTLYAGEVGRRFLLVYRAILLDTTLPGGGPPRLTYRDVANRAYCQKWPDAIPYGYVEGAGVTRRAENPAHWLLVDQGLRTKWANIDSRFGQIVRVDVAEFRAPVEADRAEPFPEKSDVRYWSIGFGSEGKTERTVADFELPASRRLFVGLGGATRPEGIRAEEWVGLTTQSGLVGVRMVLPNVPDPERLLPKLTYISPSEIR